MAFKTQKAIGLATLSALSLVEFIQLQSAQATPVTYNGTAVPNPHGGQVQVSITVDGGRLTAISTPVQPGGGNAYYSNLAIGPMTSRAYAALPVPSNAGVTASALVGVVATIQGVSGASQVSAAWKQSLQSAISSAGSAIGVQVTPPTPAAPSTPATPTFPAFTPAPGSTSTPAPTASANSTSATVSTNGLPAVCQTMSPIVNKLPEVTSAPSPEGTPTPYGAPIPSGFPTPISTATSSSGGENRNSTKTITQNQTMLQYAIQSYVKTVTKTEVQTQIITCNILPTATPTVYVTVTPSAPDLSIVIQPGAAVVLKSFTCSITKNGVTTKKVFKAKVVKCPTGYKLVKKV